MRLGDLDSVEQKVKAKSDSLFDSGEPILSGAVMAVCGIIHNQPTIDPETLPLVQELRSRNKRLKAVVKVQLEQLREKTAEIDELCEKVADLDEKLKRVKAERDAAIKELDGVSRLVDDLADFVDREIHPVVDYNLYLGLRENVDAVSMFQHEDKWRGPQKEEM